MDRQFSSFHHHHYPFLSEQDYEYPTNAPEKPRQLPSSNNTTAVPPKKSKRAVQKRVVSIPIGDPGGTRTKGEAPPPSDSWAWRKYGQKPIKGSPYPRGYYRCSSSKGCPARKQVERSRADPTMLLITYACEHNHPWPISSRHAKSGASHVPKSSPERFSPPPETVEKFADVETDAAAPLPMAEEEFCWFSDVASSPAVDSVLQSPIYAGRSSDDVEAMFFPMREEDESLFADLGELPEYSVVFRCGLRPPSLCGSIG